MSLDAAKAYNRKLLAEVLAPMMATADLDERRRVFRGEIHRAFAPGFFPSLMQLLWAVREEGQTGSELAVQLLAAVTFELRDFLAPLPSADLGPEVVCLELVAVPIAADLGDFAGSDAEEAMVALARVVIRRDDWLADGMEPLAAALGRLADAAEARPGRDVQFFAWMHEEAAKWRLLPERLGLMRWLLNLARLGSREAMYEEIRRRPPEDPFEVMLAVTALQDALRAEGQAEAADGARQVMFLLLAEGSAGMGESAGFPDAAGTVPAVGDRPAAPPALTAGDLARFPDEAARHELVGGRLLVSPLPDPRERQLAETLRAVLASFVEERHLGTIHAAQEIKLSDRDVVKPALAFVAAHRRHIAAGGLIEGTPDLVVEVKTGATSDDALGAKTTLYREAGVPEFWLFVHTEWHRACQAYGWEHGRWVMFGMDPVIRSRVLPGLAVALADVLGLP